jgi:hypothetical protein
MVLCTLVNELLNPGGQVLFYGHVLSDRDPKDVAWCFRLRVSFLLESLLCGTPPHDLPHAASVS